MKWGWLLVVFWVGLNGCGQMQSGTSSETQNTLSVRIVDSVGTPLARVRVEARSAITNSVAGQVVPARTVVYTNALGIAEFPRYGDSLQVFYAQTEKGSAQVRAAKGTVEAQIAPSGKVRGKGLPPQQWVTVQGLGKGTWSDSTGQFSLDGVPAGLVHVRVQNAASQVTKGTVGRLLAGDSVVFDSIGSQDPSPSGKTLLVRLNTTSSGAHLATGVPDVPVLLRIPASLCPWTGGRLAAVDAKTGKAFPTGTWTADRYGKESYLWVLLDTLRGLDSSREILLLPTTHFDPTISVFNPQMRSRGAWQLDPQGTWIDETGSLRTLTGQCSGLVDSGPIGNAVQCGAKDTVRFVESNMNFRDPFQISFWLRPNARQTPLLTFGNKSMSLGPTIYGNWNGWTPRFQSGNTAASRSIEPKGVIDSTGWSWVVFRATDLGPDSLIGTWFLNGLPMIMPDYRFAREDDATGALLMLAGYTGGIQGLQYAQNPRTGNAIWALWQAQKPNSGLTRWELLP